MSQMGQYYFDAIERIEGNAGGPVAPLANNVINFVGAGGVTVTGTPLTHTLTITAPGYANSFSTDAGANAVPTLGVINIAGGTNIGTISPGAGNVVTINLDDSINLVGSVTAGTTVTTTAGDITAGNVAVSNLAASFVLNKRRGAGVITSGDYLGALTFQGHDGTAMHAGAYLLATTSGTIALNRIPTTLSFWTHPDAAGAALQRFTIAPDGGITINTFGVAGVVTNSAAGLLSTTATIGVPLGGTGAATLTDHGVLIGSGVGAIDTTAVGVDGTVLIGNTAADPTWSANPTVTTVYATTFDTNVVAAAVTLAGTTLAADGTDADININITAKGAGTVIIDELTLTTDLAVTEGGTGASTLTDHGVLVGSGVAAITALAVGATGEILQGVTGADPSWLAASTDGKVLTAHTGGAPTWETPSAGGLTWSVITADQAGVVDQGYICNKVGLLTVTLPAVFAAGKTMRITGINTAVGWRIAQQAGQTIYFGAFTTTAGAGGYLEATAIRDSVEIVCVVANTSFNVISSVGNITVI